MKALVSFQKIYVLQASLANQATEKYYINWARSIAIWIGCAKAIVGLSSEFIRNLKDLMVMGRTYTA